MTIRSRDFVLPHPFLFLLYIFILKMQIAKSEKRGETSFSDVFDLPVDIYIGFISNKTKTYGIVSFLSAKYRNRRYTKDDL